MALQQIDRQKQLEIYRQMDEQIPLKVVASTHGVSVADCVRIWKTWQGSLEPYTDFTFTLDSVTAFIQSRNTSHLVRRDKNATIGDAHKGASYEELSAAG